ncbi:hypothetical protein NCS57_00914400 [Fusarium keratoplasticum]|uniref:Uncharacterized protein n=1 Tax=Fusarium keratoplasticum TaxID=1328300 RepID=A0ACC0QW17_9HYPO|nr:hypothetical protein NCS57_00914400 [Fusarium keratoplasticum]KAI8666874.1 hypothetical protein NCS57_00914400 [Fusarium keratoplasticum]
MSLDLAAKTLDLTARGIDLLAVLARISNETESASKLVKEVGRWLGKEGLDEVELKFFLQSTRALVHPNNHKEAIVFFQAVTDRRPKPSVVPLWAQPSGALGRLVASDPLQRWLTSTVCCLFRYHDERFIKLAISSFIMLASRSGQKPLSEYQLAYLPEMLQLEQVVSKVIHSNWIHIANSGIIGSDSECPRLPSELNWACKRGHNIGSHKLAVVLSRLRDPPKEIIFQSERLLTNLVLWLTWHFSGRLRIVVSGSIVYDKALGPADSSVECRVSKFCHTEGDERECTSFENGGAPSFEMFERVEGDLKSLFRGRYDNQQTLMSEPQVRQKLYQSPFRYPKGLQKSTRIWTQRTGQELLRWFCALPVEKDTMGSRLSFRVLLGGAGNLGSHQLRVSDLLGRTPELLNTYCGELGGPFIVFSPPRQSTPPTVDNLMDISDYDEDMEDEQDDEDLDFESRPPVLLKYFPILQDLVDQVRVSCQCFNCARATTKVFMMDENCLQHKAFMEVMFYFSHGIADAFGAPDVSACGEARAGDSGAMAILFDAIDTVRFNPSNLEGKIEWHTLLSTVCQTLLGCPPIDTMTDATYNDSPVDTPLPFTQHLGTTVIAIQHGDLAVVAPWLDLTQRIELRGCFRLELVQGRLCLPVDDEVAGRVLLQEVTRDTSVVETQHTEDVSDYAEMFKMPVHHAGAEIQLINDESIESRDFILVSVEQNRYKLLMRVTSEAHSRMVDPSRAIIKIARGIHDLKCKHNPARCGFVPEGQGVELSRFNELLGSWGGQEQKEKDPEEDGSSSGEALPNQATSVADQITFDDKSKHSKPLRVTHILDTTFKYNTALALSADNPTFVSSGNIC